MPWDRLPRKMLSSWVPYKRPRRCAKFTYGQSLNKSLKKAGIVEWENLITDRSSWKSIIEKISLYIFTSCEKGFFVREAEEEVYLRYIHNQ